MDKARGPNKSSFVMTDLFIDWAYNYNLSKYLCRLLTICIPDNSVQDTLSLSLRNRSILNEGQIHGAIPDMLTICLVFSEF